MQFPGHGDCLLQKSILAKRTKHQLFQVPVQKTIHQPLQVPVSQMYLGLEPFSLVGFPGGFVVNEFLGISYPTTKNNSFCIFFREKIVCLSARKSKSKVDKK